MKQLNLFVFGTLLIAGVAVAHTNVQNAAVKARMAAMSGIAAEMKTLGQMTKGATAFDRDAARAAANAIADHSAATPELFEAEETDPKSEAKALIWANFDDFTSKAGELEAVALGLANSIDSADDLGPAMSALGATCKSCHTKYRQ
ncbi:cytochrome c [Shimia sp.]|uniref:c-type cytochrome n=1 Tax=Shimia sp. TaxID=1954381 RepID=UPI003296DA74